VADLGTLERRLGTLSGRIAPTRWIAPDGSFVFVLGSEEPGRTGFFNDGDSAYLAQTIPAGPNVVRFRARLVGPATALPAGWRWEFGGSTDFGVTTYLAVTLEPGQDTIHDDLAFSLRGLVANNVSFGLAVNPPAGGPFDPVELSIPAVYLDAFVDEVAAAPFVANRFPGIGQIGVDPAAQIQFDIVSPATGDVDLSDTRVVVAGVLAYDGTLGGWQAGWSGTITQPTGVAHVLRFSVIPPASFGSLEVVTVSVTSREDSTFVPVSSSWSFTIADSTAPRMVAATAIGVSTIRVVFDESIVVPSGAAWALVRQTAPSVDATIVSATMVEPAVYDLTTSVPLTRGATYIVEATGVEDEFGNVSIAPYNRAPFVAFSPEVDARRRFDLWWMVPRLNRDEDVTRDLYKFLAILQEVVDTLIADVDRWTEILDVDVAADAYLDQMLIGLGNPFAFDLDTIDKRRLIRVLVTMYQQKGSKIGIINAIRFFVGVEVTITAYNEEGWILGESELGWDTYLAPSTSFALYSFEVNSPVALTDVQRAQIDSIVDYLKPAHTHHVRTNEPGPPDDPGTEFWILGDSALGYDTVLFADDVYYVLVDGFYLTVDGSRVII